MRFIALILILSLPQLAHAGSYLRVSALSALDGEADFSTDDFKSVDFDNGTGYSIAAGTSLVGLLEGEVEIYHSARSGESTLDSLDVDALSFFANGYVNLPSILILDPYIGAGIGVSKLELSEKSKSENFDDTQFTYQLMAGVSVDVSKETSVRAGYRFVDAAEISFNRDGIEEFLDYADHSVEIGVKISF